MLNRLHTSSSVSEVLLIFSTVKPKSQKNKGTEYRHANTVLMLRFMGLRI